ncbi:MAG: hypothetical protein U1F68_20080 [Gammaproteobacteria bacterium]
MEVLSQALFLLFARRSTRGRGIYAIAALPILIAAVMGRGHGLLPPYLILGLACLAQYWRPTLFGWLVMFLLYLTASAVLITELAADAWKIGTQQYPNVLISFMDGLIFTLFTVWIAGITWALVVLRPRWNRFAELPKESLKQ